LCGRLAGPRFLSRRSAASLPRARACRTDGFAQPGPPPSQAGGSRPSPFPVDITEFRLSALGISLRDQQRRFLYRRRGHGSAWRAKPVFGANIINFRMARPILFDVAGLPYVRLSHQPRCTYSHHQPEQPALGAQEAKMRNNQRTPWNGAAKRCAICDGRFGLVRYYAWQTPLCSKRCADRFKIRQEADRRWLPRFEVA